jgi:signal transduction histidine kinase/DNA-binding NarL/FixJ family response regulator
MLAPNILIVDDDDHVREALVDELSGSYRVEAVGSGGEAMDALASHQYDVVISDLKMPDHDGIEVLEFARQHQGDAVRVLLTGYLDDRANRALMGPGAPYKVGKPWHDEIEIVVRRGLEHREVARRLAASVEDALGLSTFDDELAIAQTVTEISEAVIRRVLMIEGVTSCSTTLGERPPSQPLAKTDSNEWSMDIPLDGDGQLRMRARGVGDSSRQLVSYIAHRAQRRGGLIEARLAPVRSLVGPTAARTNMLMRQAALGTLSSSLLHDMASMIQTLTIALGEVALFTDGIPGANQAITDANAAGHEMVQLFVEMRKFIRDGEVALRRNTVPNLVSKVRRLVSGYLRGRATLQISELPDVEVAVSEPLFVQVLANLLRNAANVSPAGGKIDLTITVDEREVEFTVVDDGPGVAPEIADYMFEAFATTRHEGTGLGLAISAYVMQLLGGTISYRKTRDRGACFAVTVPRTAAGSGQMAVAKPAE